MEKKGDATLTLIALGIAIVAIIVVSMFLYVAKSIASGKAAAKTTFARDIALTIDALYSYPYDVEVKYEADLSQFIVSISGNTVKIYDSSYVSLDSNNNLKGNDPMFAQYSFASINEKPEFIFNKPKMLVFKKIDSRLTITAQNEAIA